MRNATPAEVLRIQHDCDPDTLMTLIKRLDHCWRGILAVDPRNNLSTKMRLELLTSGVDFYDQRMTEFRAYFGHRVTVEDHFDYLAGEQF